MEEAAITNWHPSRRIYLATVLATAFAYAVLAFLVLNNDHRVSDGARHQGALLGCISKWSERFTVRSSILTRIGNRRSDDLNFLIHAVAERDNAKFQVALKDYIVADNLYQKAQQQHPIPQVPRLICR